MLTKRMLTLCAITLLALSSVTLMAARSRTPTRRMELVAMPHPECPQGGNWELFFLGWHGDSAIFDIDNPANYSVVKTPHSAMIGHGELAGPGPITNIVEFHDCQQFISRSGSQRAYSDLFAIFARLRLDAPFVSNAKLRRGQSTHPPDNRGGRVLLPQLFTPFNPASDGIPMATIFAYSTPYSPLSLRRGFNCLHFFRRQMPGRAPGWVAKITPVGPDGEAQCADPLPASAATDGPVFAVDRGPTRTSSDLPPVARWDWDPVNQLQYIGIQCEDAWCEVRPRLAPGHTPRSSAPLATAPQTVKGWYDEQLLALPPVPPAPVTAVSNIMGTVIPEPNLGEPMGQDGAKSIYHNTWQPVASVRLDRSPGGYASKLNFVATEGTDAQNHVALCYGITDKNGFNPCIPNRVGRTVPVPKDESGKACSGWFTRVGRTRDENGNEQYFCATRRGHDTDMNGNPIPHIPGVVRWRWALKDETMWIRCLQGCCEVQARS